MKKIEAFIRHEALEGIHDRLAAMSYRGARTTIFLRPKLKLEMVVDDRDLERAIDCILELAHTGQPGDGKIFILEVEQSIRVRTGERGPEVLEAHDH